MGYYRVMGGGTIGGEYTVRGSKNAVLPILAASILAGDEVVLENVPHITDVFVSLEILEELGCKTKLEGRTLTIDSRNIEKTEISEEMVGKMRSSIPRSSTMRQENRKLWLWLVFCGHAVRKSMEKVLLPSW